MPKKKTKGIPGSAAGGKAGKKKGIAAPKKKTGALLKIPIKKKVGTAAFEPVSKYFSHDPKLKLFKKTSGVRPSNQSYITTVRNVAEWIIEAVPVAMRHTIQKRFLEEADSIGLSKMNGGKGIDMAHVISIAEIGGLVTAMLNVRSVVHLAAKQTEKMQAARQFVRDFLTTDAEDKKEFDLIVQTMMRKGSARVLGQAADQLMDRLNRVRKNLTGGDAATNRTILQHRDVWPMKDGTVRKELKKRQKAVGALGKKLGVAEFKALVLGKKAVTSTFSGKSPVSGL